ncbi:MAG: zinc transport system substrate-binding protein [Frankiales bacterium]|jgi:zinc transport system substrate-binding protein|nr:zinc transport system substrate-binding protein [Frankiales bacterium]
MRRASLCLLLLLTGCSAGLAHDGKVQVVASAYPFAWLAQRVGGPTVDVTDLVPPGAEPHDVELSPQQVGLVSQASVVVYLHGFQPSVDDALGSGKQGFDLGTVVTQQPLTTGGEQTSKDPHIWLDPVRMEAAADALADRLAAKDPSHAADYRARAAAVKKDLEAVDTLFQSDLMGCARHEIVTSHSAFGYLGARYGLVQLGITGVSPDEEPTPKKVVEVAQYAKAHHVTTIFFESLVDPKVAKTVAAEIGAKTAVLDPVEGVHGSDDYLSVQGRNAAALHTALGCR